MTQDFSTKKKPLTGQEQAELLLNLVNRMNIAMTELLAIISPDYENHPLGPKVLGNANSVVNGLAGLAGVYNTVLSQMRAREGAQTAAEEPVKTSVNLSTGAAMEVKPYFGGERPPTMQQRQPRTQEELNDELPQPARTGIPYVDLSSAAPTLHTPHPVSVEKYGEESPYFNYLSPQMHRFGRGSLRQSSMLNAYREDILGTPIERLKKFPNGFYGATPDGQLSQLYIHHNENYAYVWVYRDDTARHEGLHLISFELAETKSISVLDGDRAAVFLENFERLMRNLVAATR